MKSGNLFTLCATAMVLAFGALNASATTCASISGSTLNTIVGAGSCTIGDLTFSNFYFNFTSGVNTGAPNGVNSPTDPNPSSNVTLTFSEYTDGVTSDAWGSTGSLTTPLYELITNYSAGSDSVNEYQNEQYYISYLVTDTLSGAVINEVDDNVVGSAMNGATATLTNKSICDGGAFVQSGGIPSSTCSTGGRNSYQAVDLGSGGTSISGGAGASGADSTEDFSFENGGAFQGGSSYGSANFGVYDQANMNGGNTSVSGTASVSQVENDFVEELPSGTPEPATFVLFGGALVALGVLRRKKSV
jgi:hypothetical protein